MATAFRDYYQTLGVARTASADEIKKAFRKLARLHHPDVAKDKKAGEAKFKEINEAYEVLGDPTKRQKYDELGEHWNQQGGPPPGYESAPRGAEGAPEFHFEGTGFSDFFEQFFGGGRGFSGGFSNGGRGGARGGRAAGPVHGQDVEGAISVTLHEAMAGAVREISLQSVDPSTGQAKVERFKVRIPKGALEGQVIRVPGKGGPGAGGGEAGHLFLRVRLASHPDFRASGADLYHDLPLAPWEAVLGTTVRVSGLDGELDVKIPPGTANGQKLRLRGRGLPLPKSTERGDLYVVAEVEVPKQVAPRRARALGRARKILHLPPPRLTMSASSPSPEDSQLYSIETVEQITHLERERIVLYQHYGLVRAVPEGDALRFDDAALLRLRRLAFLLSEYQLNEAGLRHFASLLDEVERLRDEVRFLRG